VVNYKRAKAREADRGVSQFEAVLGKNPPYGILKGVEDRRGMVWWLFATLLERADTIGSH